MPFTEEESNVTDMNPGIKDSQEQSSQGTEEAASSSEVQGDQSSTSEQQAKEALGLGELDWNAPIQWETQEGQQVEATVGDLVKAYQGLQENVPYLEVGQLFEKAAMGDAEAVNVLTQMLQVAEQQRMEQQGQTPPSPQQQLPPEQAGWAEPSPIDELGEVVDQRVSAIEQLEMDRIAGEIKTGLQSFIQNSNYTALKELPEAVDLIYEQLVDMTGAGVQVTQEDVNEIAKQLDAEFKETALKIAQKAGATIPDTISASIPSLGTGAAAPASTTSFKARWGKDLDNPDPKFRQELLQRIQNALMEGVA